MGFPKGLSLTGYRAYQAGNECKHLAESEKGTDQVEKGLLPILNFLKGVVWLAIFLMMCALQGLSTTKGNISTVSDAVNDEFLPPHSSMLTGWETITCM